MIFTLGAIACVAWLAYRLGYDEGELAGREAARRGTRARRRSSGALVAVEGRRMRG